MPPRPSDSVGVSPIIGVLLIVALTVALVALTAYISFNITDEVHTTPQVTITESENTLTIIHSRNVDEIVVREGGFSEQKVDVGDSYTIQGDYQLSVIGINKGQETLIKSTKGTSISNRNTVEPDDLEEIFNNMPGNGTEGNPYIITNDYELQSVEMEPDADYKLGNNIDASGTQSWNDNKGFEPISEFEGSLDGLGYSIVGLKIDRADESHVSLIRNAEGEIYNMSIEESTIKGGDNVGSLVGENRNHIDIKEIQSKNNIITGEDNVGGLIGKNHNHGNIRKSSSDDIIQGENNVGGIVGTNNHHANIYDSYSISSVVGTDYVGGIVGNNNHHANIYESYVSGSISGTNNTGGITGTDSGEIRNSYIDTESTGQDGTNGGTVLSIDEMTGEDAKENMVFDFENKWSTVDGDYPVLEWQNN